MSNKQYRDDWSLKPLQGLGRLKFGMSQEEAAEFDSIYGVPDLVLPLGSKMVREFRQNNDLQTLFIDNKLKVITVILPFEQICFAGKQIGDIEGFYVVTHMMKMIDETPVALDNDLVFQKACLSLWNFTWTWGDEAYVLWDYEHYDDDDDNDDDDDDDNDDDDDDDDDYEDDDNDGRGSISLMADLDGYQDLPKYIPVPPNPTPYGYSGSMEHQKE